MNEKLTIILSKQVMQCGCYCKFAHDAWFQNSQNIWRIKLLINFKIVDNYDMVQIVL